LNELDTLKSLLDAGHIKLGVNIRRMNSPGSPIYRSWENVWPPGLVLVASVIALKWGGMLLEAVGIHQGAAWLATGVLGLGCWWWISQIMPKVKDGVFDRTAGYALQSPGHFDVLWGQGILSFYAKMPDGTERAATRRDSWRDFVTAIDAELKGQG
jgi:hypothetical protein